MSKCFMSSRLGQKSTRAHRCRIFKRTRQSVKIRSGLFGSTRSRRQSSPAASPRSDASGPRTGKEMLSSDCEPAPTLLKTCAHGLRLPVDTAVDGCYDPVRTPLDSVLLALHVELPGQRSICLWPVKVLPSVISVSQGV